MACALFWGVLQCLLLTTRSVRPTFLQARSALYDGFSKADFDALWRLAEQQVQSPSPEVQQETGHHKVLQKKLPCQSTIMGPKGVNNCEFRAYPRNEMVLEKNGWLYAPALLKLVLNPRILKAVEEITGAEPLLWGANIGTAQPGDLQAWHLDVEMGDCWNRGATVWMGLDGMTPDNSLWIINGSAAKEGRFACPAALVKSCAGAPDRTLCQMLSTRRDYGTVLKCAKILKSTAVTCEAAIRDLRGRQTEQVLDCHRKVVPDATLLHLPIWDAEFVTFAGSVLHMTFNSALRTRKAIQIQFVSRDCPIRHPSSYYWPRPSTFAMYDPKQMSPAIDAWAHLQHSRAYLTAGALTDLVVGNHSHSNGISSRNAQDDSDKNIRDRVAPAEVLDIAQNYVIELTRPDSAPEYAAVAFVSGKPWLLTPSITAGRVARHNTFGGAVATPAPRQFQTCHLGGMEVIDALYAPGLPPHTLHFHDQHVHTLCYQYIGTVHYAFRRRPVGARASVWEGPAGTVTWLPGGEAHAFRCAAPGRSTCRLTCVRFAVRDRRPEACAEGARAGAATRTGTGVVKQIADDLSAGRLFQVQERLDEAFAARSGGKAAVWGSKRIQTGQTATAPQSEMLLHGTVPAMPGAAPTAACASVHIRVADLAPGSVFRTSAAAADVAMVVIRGACNVTSLTPDSRVHRRFVKTGDTILAPSRTAVDVQIARAVRLLVLEVSAGVRCPRPGQG